MSQLPEFLPFISLKELLDLLDRLRGMVSSFWREVAKFGVVGALAFIIDSGVNWLLITGPLYDSEVWAKAVATVVSSLFSWIGNRFWTFRHGRDSNVVREAVLFFLINGVGLLISTGCVWVAKYIFGLDSRLWIFLSGSVIGVILGTIFRFFAYRSLVFNKKPGEESEFCSDNERIEV